MFKNQKLNQLLREADSVASGYSVDATPEVSFLNQHAFQIRIKSWCKSYRIIVKAREIVCCVRDEEGKEFTIRAFSATHEHLEKAMREFLRPDTEAHDIYLFNKDKEENQK